MLAVVTSEPGDGLGAAYESTPSEVEALYDDWVTDYDRDVIRGGYEAPAVAAGLLADLVDRDTPLLDAGCGTGLTGVELARRGFTDIVGVDTSSESVDVAASLGVYRYVRRADLNQPLDFAGDEFGAVLCCGVLSYVPDLDAVLAEFMRVVWPGGTIVFTQRTDLWDARDNQATIDRLVAAGSCRATVSEPGPYLPAHPDFGDDVLVRYVTMTTSG